MTEADQLSDEALVAEVEARQARLSPEHKVRLSAALAERSRVKGALADAGAADGSPTEAAAETPFARFKAQYDALPKGNILAQGSTWETVQARLSDPQNADKLRKVTAEMDEPRLYAVMEDGSLEFVDGNPDTPPMFVKDKETGVMQIIYKRDAEQMDAARAQIEAGTHQWGSIEEMLQWAAENGFEVFDADINDSRWFGKEMKLAEAASSTGKFVGKSGSPWMATALKGARYADFVPDSGDVLVNSPSPAIRDDLLGLLRRLRV